MKHSKKRNKRKMLLVLPLLLLPFLALAFYAMGGGRKEKGEVIAKGINATLPGASFKNEQSNNKMDIYRQSERDSMDRSSGLSGIAEKLGFDATQGAEQTREIEEKISALHQEINRTTPQSAGVSRNRNIMVPGMKSDVDRLEVLMKGMQSGKGEDEEMKQLSGMLEKVLDIQHPERVRESYLRQVVAGPDSLFTAIPATIVEKQRVIQGTSLKLQLQDSVVIAGQVFPKGQEVSGIVNLTNQRLLLDIKTIRVGKKIIPVDLSVYGLDGIKGINAPDAIGQSAISGGADDALRSIQLLGMDASVGAQFAGAGIDAAKGLFSKKVRRIKVKLAAGYQVLLRINNNNLK